MDFDVVDYTNLQRQIIHATPDVGRSKVQSASEKIAAINPFVAVEAIDAKLNSENALEIIRVASTSSRMARTISPLATS